MTASDGVAELNDATAMLAAFLKSDWRSLDLCTEDITIFISRETAATRVVHPDAPSPERATERAICLIRTPRLGTVRSCVGRLASVSDGEAYATLEILGEPFDLVSDTAFEVAEVLCTPGELMEYDAPILKVWSGGAPDNAQLFQPVAPTFQP